MDRKKCNLCLRTPVTYVPGLYTPEGEGERVRTMSAATETESLVNKTVVIEVEGMTCEGCAVHINETLRKLKGVISAEANYPKKNVKVVFNPKQITLIFLIIT